MSEPLRLEHTMRTSHNLSVELPYQDAVDVIVALVRSRGLELPDGDWRVQLPMLALSKPDSISLCMHMSDEQSKVVSLPAPNLNDGRPEPWTPPATKDG